MRVMKDDVRAQSAADQRLAELVRSAEPYAPNPFRKRLVLLRLERAAEGHRSHFMFRSALTATLVLAGTASALAALGAVGYRFLGAETATEPAVTGTARALKPGAKAPSVRREGPEASPPDATEQSSQAEPSSRAERASRRGERSDTRARAAATNTRRPSVASGEDPSQVLEAVRALRKEGDAARAQALLDDYLASQPNGALTEDALGLAIEAAAARRDPRAPEYARRYLQRFPNGRFRAVAERAAARR